MKRYCRATPPNIARNRSGRTRRQREGDLFWKWICEMWQDGFRRHAEQGGYDYICHTEFVSCPTSPSAPPATAPPGRPATDTGGSPTA